MGAPIELHEVTPATRPVVERLWQLYRHDLSEFRDSAPAPDGLFPDRVLAEHLDQRRGPAFLARRGEVPVGFVLVLENPGSPPILFEFFVVRRFRRQGIGRELALLVLRAKPGLWRTAFQEENPAAARFWRGLAEMLDPGGWTEERRPVAGKPAIPPDVWISFKVGA